MTSLVLHAAVPGGTASAPLHLPDLRPDDAAPLPLVVFYPDAGGPRATMTAMAERLAAHDHAVLLMNPYERLPPYAPFDMHTAFSDPAERTRIMALIQGFDTQVLVSDTVALLDTITHPRIDTTRLATMGYCMGGRVAFLAATQLGARVAAVAAIHAGGLVNDKPQSPHKQLGRARARFYVGVADADASCTTEHQAALEAAFREAGLTHQLELYAGAKHGFAVPDFPVYDATAAERHWERVLALFEATLR